MYVGYLYLPITNAAPLWWSLWLMCGNQSYHAGIQHAGGASAPAAALTRTPQHGGAARGCVCALRMPAMIPSAPLMTHTVEMRWPKCGMKERAVKQRV